MESQKPGVELLSDLSERISTSLVQAGVSNDLADRLGEEIAMDMATHWGGQLIYFPKGTFVRLSRRDRDIYSQFTGNNHKELSRKFNVSEQHIYRIVKAMRRRDLDDRHGDLFSPA